MFQYPGGVSARAQCSRCREITCLCCSIAAVFSFSSFSNESRERLFDGDESGERHFGGWGRAGRVPIAR